jgi:hypothetical protein
VARSDAPGAKPKSRAARDRRGAANDNQTETQSTGQTRRARQTGSGEHMICA